MHPGRLHRLHPGKAEVWTYDYLDRALPVLVKMFERLRLGYRRIGHEVEGGGGQASRKQPKGGAG